jgi:hypothetical protein
MPLDPQVFADFIATVHDDPEMTDKVALSRFPEFNNDMTLVSRARKLTDVVGFDGSREKLDEELKKNGPDHYKSVDELDQELTLFKKEGPDFLNKPLSSLSTLMRVAQGRPFLNVNELDETRRLAILNELKVRSAQREAENQGNNPEKTKSVTPGGLKEMIFGSENMMGALEPFTNAIEETLSPLVDLVTFGANEQPRLNKKADADAAMYGTNQALAAKSTFIRDADNVPQNDPNEVVSFAENTNRIAPELELEAITKFPVVERIKNAIENPIARERFAANSGLFYRYLSALENTAEGRLELQHLNDVYSGGRKDNDGIVQNNTATTELGKMLGFYQQKLKEEMGGFQQTGKGKIVRDINQKREHLNLLAQQLEDMKTDMIIIRNDDKIPASQKAKAEEKWSSLINEATTIKNELDQADIDPATVEARKTANVIQTRYQGMKEMAQLLNGIDPEGVKHNEEIAFEALQRRANIEDNINRSFEHDGLGGQIWTNTKIAGSTILGSLARGALNIASTAARHADEISSLGQLGRLNPNVHDQYNTVDRVIDGAMASVMNNALTDFKLNEALFTDGGKINPRMLTSAITSSLVDMFTLIGGARIAALGLGKMGMGATLADKVGLIASGYAVQFPSIYDEGIAAGLTKEQAFSRAMVTTLPIATMELIEPNTNMLRFKANGAGTIGKLKAAKILFQDVKKGLESTQIAIKATAKEVIKENIQEISQSYGQYTMNAAYNQIYGQKLFADSPAENELKETMLLTTTSTLLMQGGSNTLARIQTGANYSQRLYNQSMLAAAKDYDWFSRKFAMDVIKDPTLKPKADEVMAKMVIAATVNKMYGHLNPDEKERVYQLEEGKKVWSKIYDPKKTYTPEEKKDLDAIYKSNVDPIQKEIKKIVQNSFGVLMVNDKKIGAKAFDEYMDSPELKADDLKHIVVFNNPKAQEKVNGLREKFGLDVEKTVEKPIEKTAEVINTEETTTQKTNREAREANAKKTTSITEMTPVQKKQQEEDKRKKVFDKKRLSEEIMVHEQEIKELEPLIAEQQRTGKRNQKVEKKFAEAQKNLEEKKAQYEELKNDPVFAKEQAEVDRQLGITAHKAVAELKQTIDQKKAELPQIVDDTLQAQANDEIVTMENRLVALQEEANKYQAPAQGPVQTMEVLATSNEKDDSHPEQYADNEMKPSKVRRKGQSRTVFNDESTLIGDDTPVLIPQNKDKSQRVLTEKEKEMLKEADTLMDNINQTEDPAMKDKLHEMFIALRNRFRESVNKPPVYSAEENPPAPVQQVEPSGPVVDWMNPTGTPIAPVEAPTPIKIGVTKQKKIDAINKKRNKTLSTVSTNWENPTTPGIVQSPTGAWGALTNVDQDVEWFMIKEDAEAALNKEFDSQVNEVINPTTKSNGKKTKGKGRKAEVLTPLQNDGTQPATLNMSGLVDTMSKLIELENQKDETTDPEELNLLNEQTNDLSEDEDTLLSETIPSEQKQPAERPPQTDSAVPKDDPSSGYNLHIIQRLRTSLSNKRDTKKGLERRMIDKVLNRADQMIRKGESTEALAYLDKINTKWETWDENALKNHEALYILRHQLNNFFEVFGKTVYHVISNQIIKLQKAGTQSIFIVDHIKNLLEQLSIGTKDWQTGIRKALDGIGEYELYNEIAKLVQSVASTSGLVDPITGEKMNVIATKVRQAKFDTESSEKMDMLREIYRGFMILLRKNRLMNSEEVIMRVLADTGENRINFAEGLHNHKSYMRMVVRLQNLDPNEYPDSKFRSDARILGMSLANNLTQSDAIGFYNIYHAMQSIEVRVPVFAPGGESKFRRLNVKNTAARYQKMAKKFLDSIKFTEGKTVYRGEEAISRTLNNSINKIKDLGTQFGFAVNANRIAEAKRIQEKIHELEKELLGKLTGENWTPYFAFDNKELEGFDEKGQPVIYTDMTDKLDHINRMPPKQGTTYTKGMATPYSNLLNALMIIHKNAEGLKKQGKDSGLVKAMNDFFFAVPSNADGTPASESNIVKLANIASQSELVEPWYKALKGKRVSSYEMTSQLHLAGFRVMKVPGITANTANGKTTREDKDMESNDIRATMLMMWKNLQDEVGTYFHPAGQFGDKTHMYYVEQPRLEGKDLADALKELREDERFSILIPTEEEIVEMAKDFQQNLFNYSDMFTGEQMAITNIIEFYKNYIVHDLEIKKAIHGTNFLDQYKKGGKFDFNKMIKRASNILSPGVGPVNGIEGGVAETFNVIVSNDKKTGTRLAAFAEKVSSVIVDAADGVAYVTREWAEKYQRSLGDSLTNRSNNPDFFSFKSIYSFVKGEGNEMNRQLTKVNYIVIDELAAKFPGSEFDKLAQLMKKEGADIIVFESGTKVTTDPQSILYDDESNLIKNPKVTIVPRQSAFMLYQQDLRHDTTPANAKMPIQAVNLFQTLSRNGKAIGHNIVDIRNKLVKEFTQEILTNDKSPKRAKLLQLVDPRKDPDLYRFLSTTGVMREPIFLEQIVGILLSNFNDNVMNIPTNRVVTQDIPAMDVKLEILRVAKDGIHLLPPEANCNVEGIRYKQTTEFTTQAELIAYIMENKEQFVDLFHFSQSFRRGKDFDLLSLTEKHLNLWELDEQVDGKFVIPGELLMGTRVPLDNYHSAILYRANVKLAGKANFFMTNAQDMRTAGLDYDGDARFVSTLFKDAEGRPILTATALGISNQLFFNVASEYSDARNFAKLSKPIDKDSLELTIDPSRVVPEVAMNQVLTPDGYLIANNKNVSGVILKSMLTNLNTTLDFIKSVGIMIEMGDGTYQYLTDAMGSIKTFIGNAQNAAFDMAAADPVLTRMGIDRDTVNAMVMAIFKDAGVHAQMDKIEEQITEILKQNIVDSKRGIEFSTPNEESYAKQLLENTNADITIHLATGLDSDALTKKAVEKKGKSYLHIDGTKLVATAERITAIAKNLIEQLKLGQQSINPTQAIIELVKTGQPIWIKYQKNSTVSAEWRRLEKSVLSEDGTQVSGEDSKRGENRTFNIVDRSRLLDVVSTPKAISINLTGNDLKALNDRFTQEQLDPFVYELIKGLQNELKGLVEFDSIRTSDKTGYSEAVAKASLRLGITTSVLLESKVDEQQSKDRFTTAMMEEGKQYRKDHYPETTEHEALRDSLAQGLPNAVLELMNDSHNAVMEAVKQLVSILSSEDADYYRQTMQENRRPGKVSEQKKLIDMTKDEIDPILKQILLDGQNLSSLNNIIKWTKKVPTSIGEFLSDIYSFRFFLQGIKEKDGLYKGMDFSEAVKTDYWQSLIQMVGFAEDFIFGDVKALGKFFKDFKVDITNPESANEFNLRLTNLLTIRKIKSLDPGKSYRQIFHEIIRFPTSLDAIKVMYPGNSFVRALVITPEGTWIDKSTGNQSKTYRMGVDADIIAATENEDFLEYQKDFQKLSPDLQKQFLLYHLYIYGVNSVSKYGGFLAMIHPEYIAKTSGLIASVDHFAANKGMSPEEKQLDNFLNELNKAGISINEVLKSVFYENSEQVENVGKIRGWLYKLQQSMGEYENGTKYYLYEMINRFEKLYDKLGNGLGSVKSPIVIELKGNALYENSWQIYEDLKKGYVSALVMDKANLKDVYPGAYVNISTPYGEVVKVQITGSIIPMDMDNSIDNWEQSTGLGMEIYDDLIANGEEEIGSLAQYVPMKIVTETQSFTEVTDPNKTKLRISSSNPMAQYLIEQTGLQGLNNVVLFGSNTDQISNVNENGISTVNNLPITLEQETPGNAITETLKAMMPEILNEFDEEGITFADKRDLQIALQADMLVFAADPSEDMMEVTGHEVASFVGQKTLKPMYVLATDPVNGWVDAYVFNYSTGVFEKIGYYEIPMGVNNIGIIGSKNSQEVASTIMASFHQSHETMVQPQTVPILELATTIVPEKKAVVSIGNDFATSMKGKLVNYRIVNGIVYQGNKVVTDIETRALIIFKEEFKRLYDGRDLMSDDLNNGDSQRKVLIPVKIDGLNKILQLSLELQEDGTDKQVVIELSLKEDSNRIEEYLVALANERLGEEVTIADYRKKDYSFFELHALLNALINKIKCK